MHSLFASYRRSAPSALLLGAFAAFSAFASEPNSVTVAATERQDTRIAAYQPRFERPRPIVAVVAENSGTELIDFVVPYGIMSQSGAADVVAVATQAAPVRLRPALTIQPQATTESFDHRFPDGADYVIVPAVMSIDKTPPLALLAWIKEQAGKGATIVSICDGALVVAMAGLFKGHRATGHWATQARREHDFPDTEWVENIRYVADGKVISSAGITAAIPLSLALVEAIAGTDRAARVAKEIGVSDWSAEHDSEQFRPRLGTYFTAIRNWLSPNQDVGLPVAAGVDEIGLALQADAYSRTHRRNTYTVALSNGGFQTRNGLTLLPDRIAGEPNEPQHVAPALDDAPSALVLDRALADIVSAYGRSTANFVALQLEYPQPTQPR